MVFRSPTDMRGKGDKRGPLERHLRSLRRGSVDLSADLADVVEDVAALGTWSGWTPSLVNLNAGSTGTVSAVYAEVNGIIYFDIQVTLGGTGISVGSPTFSVPVAEDPGYSSGADDRVAIGIATLIDAGVGTWDGVVTIDDGVFRPRSLNASSTHVVQNDLSSTSPFTWAAGDRMYLHGWYRRG